MKLKALSCAIAVFCLTGVASASPVVGVVFDPFTDSQLVTAGEGQVSVTSTHPGPFGPLGSRSLTANRQGDPDPNRTSLSSVDQVLASIGGGVFACENTGIVVGQSSCALSYSVQSAFYLSGLEFRGFNDGTPLATGAGFVEFYLNNTSLGGQQLAVGTEFYSILFQDRTTFSPGDEFRITQSTSLGNRTSLGAISGSGFGTVPEPGTLTLALLALTAVGVGRQRSA